MNNEPTVDGLPPLSKSRLSALRRLIRRIPPALREDAIQEAWLAHLQGEDVCACMEHWRRRECGRAPGITNAPEHVRIERLTDHANSPRVS